MSASRTTRFASALLGIVSVAGCGEPEVDDFRHNGGAAPDPTGVIEGTVAYVGPRPICEGGQPIGNVILTLFHYDNPPPPGGSATSAKNLIVVPGTELFTSSRDCLRDGATAEEQAEVIMRSASFVWPEIELGPGTETVDYQIRGFYDRDGDFLPFFSVKRLPTQGDVVGAALENVLDVFTGQPALPLKIRFSGIESSSGRRGEIVGGVTVFLGAVVNTELPMFHLDYETGTPLSAESTIPKASSFARAGILNSLTPTKLQHFASDDADLAEALEAAGLEFSFDEPGYSWYARYILDANRDGMGGDLHPIFGPTSGLQWATPGVIFRRERSALEAAAGIPDVLIIASVNALDLAIPGAPEVRDSEVTVTVAPVAVLDLVAGNPACRMPYIPPGSFALTYEGRNPETGAGERLADCHELPTGRYAVNVLHGIAGATASDENLDEAGEPEVRSSETDIFLNGGQFSGQAWSIPNELGLESQIGAAAIASQGPDGQFLVYDPEPDNNEGAADLEVPSTRIPACVEAENCLPTSSDDGCDGTYRQVQYVDELATDLAVEITAAFEATCCGAIVHLCGLPLCESVAAPTTLFGADDTWNVRASPTSDPIECIPFPMPTICCRNAGVE